MGGKSILPFPVNTIITAGSELKMLPKLKLLTCDGKEPRIGLENVK